jgi:release factor glutamine methyltransferase
MSLLPHQINLILKMKQDPFDPKFQTGEPIEYILGKAEFRDNLYIVNSNVLIPRVETEEIIHLALKYLQSIELFDNTSMIKFADIATGSGAIGISFALGLEKKNQSYQCYLSDVSEDALDVAKSNAESLLKDTSRIEIIKSDLLHSYPENIKFDVIFANLPYIPTERLDTLDSSVKDYEPLLALDGGPDGLDLIREIVVQARNYLETDGILILEVDDTHDETMIPVFDLGNSPQPEVTVVLDQFGKNRFWIVKY